MNVWDFCPFSSVECARFCRKLDTAYDGCQNDRLSPDNMEISRVQYSYTRIITENHRIILLKSGKLDYAFNQVSRIIPNFLNGTFHLFGEHLLTNIFFTAKSFLFGATIVNIPLLFLGGNHTPASSAFHKSRKNIFVLFDIFTPASFSHYFLNFIKKFLVMIGS